MSKTQLAASPRGYLNSSMMGLSLSSRKHTIVDPYAQVVDEDIAIPLDTHTCPNLPQVVLRPQLSCYVRFGINLHLTRF
jgi:hypothetical protein